MYGIAIFNTSGVVSYTLIIPDLCCILSIPVIRLDKGTVLLS